MSYLLEIGTRDEPTPERIAAVVGDLGLSVTNDGLEGEDGCRIEVDGPYAGGVVDSVLAECPEAAWRMTVALTGSAEPSLAYGRAFAQRVVDGCGGGAVFDPQFDRVVWPRPSPEPPPEGTPTTRVELSWFVAPARWREAPGALIRALGRYCPEALPLTYGRYEPPPHEFRTVDFIRFAQDEEKGSGLWRSARPSLGGGWSAPHAVGLVEPDEEDRVVARLRMAFDGRALDGNPVLREAVAAMFASAAAELGAFFACAQAEPGWLETAAGQLVPTREARLRGNDRVLNGLAWQGLPPVPMWLTWFGGPYRELVGDTLPAGAYVAPAETGVFVRLGADPRPNGEPGGWLPPELTYVHRPAYRERPDGSISSDLPQPEDRAAVIPPLA